MKRKVHEPFPEEGEGGGKLGASPPQVPDLTMIPIESFTGG